MSLQAYADRTIEVLKVEDITQGLYKSLVFAVIITLVSFVNGFSVTAGAEGVGKATTRSVVLSITYIIIADMVFTFFLTH
jgi:phospholipid/cholesterol/gamma-HCH transport system permease protein